MKKVIYVLATTVAMALTMSSCASQKLNKDTGKYRYDIECAGTGSQGTYLVKVWSYSSNQKAAANQALKNAVHGVIFKGVSGSATLGCPGQRALAAYPGVETENAEFFKRFFSDDNGEYGKYVSGTSAAIETVKSGNMYKVGVTVSVHKDALRQALEAAGIVKGLNSGF